MNIITEIVTFKIIEDLSEGDFINIVEELEANFHSLQKGFIDTELLQDKSNNEWIILQHWDSSENLHAASKKMFIDEKASVFVKSLIPQSVKMRIVSQIKTWNLE